MSTWYRSMLPSAPTLPPHGHCSGHGASKVLSGTGIARTACRPYLDPGLRPGFFGSRFGLSLEKGAAWRLPARRDSSSTLSSLAIRASRRVRRVHFAGICGFFKPRCLASTCPARSTSSPTSCSRRDSTPKHVPRAVDLLTDIVLAPRFDAEELERVRMVIFEEKSDR